MDWVFKLCSCITPQFRYSFVDYLNSKQLNNQVIQQEKCSEQLRDNNEQAEPEQPENHVYSIAKTKSYNYIKANNQNQQYEDRHLQKSEKQNDEEVIDIFWYPKSKKLAGKFEHFNYILNHKLKILTIIFQEDPGSHNYDKIYDSQDQLGLVIYCRLETLLKGKKINSYRFSFNVQGLNLQFYDEWLTKMNDKQIFPLLIQSNELDSDPTDNKFRLFHRYFKKLLVVSPHDLLTVQKTIKNLDQEKTITTIVFSVEQDQTLLQQQKNTSYSRGWLHLAGLEVFQSQSGLQFIGYLTLQLDVSVSPNMLKQPISKQIRSFVQKFVSKLKDSDQI